MQKQNRTKIKHLTYECNTETLENNKQNDSLHKLNWIQDVCCRKVLSRELLKMYFYNFLWIFIVLQGVNSHMLSLVIDDMNGVIYWQLVNAT